MLKMYKVYDYHNLNLTLRFLVFSISLKVQALQSMLVLWKQSSKLLTFLITFELHLN